MTFNTKEQWVTWTRITNPGSWLQEHETAIFDQWELLAKLKETPQDPIFHPEGNVWVHTCYVCDAAAVVSDREGLSQHERMILLIAALCHDIGKPGTTEMIDGRWRARGHEQRSKVLAMELLSSLGFAHQDVSMIGGLVAEHLVYASFETVTLRIIKRLKHRLGGASISLLCHLIEADQSGRPPLTFTPSQTFVQLLQFAQERKTFE
ncbi:MAG: HD domain-containing protein [Pseudobacteriovorax sp.]|nr:HD domain-containing protein [Pseudobacteriovorax sp.]